jgi:hypothetical protein
VKTRLATRWVRAAAYGAALGVATSLVACSPAKTGPAGERLKASDTSPWSGTTSRSLAPGWQGSGDAQAWSEQIKQRARGQNEYPTAQ